MGDLPFNPTEHLGSEHLVKAPRQAWTCFCCGQTIPPHTSHIRQHYYPDAAHDWRYAIPVRRHLACKLALVNPFRDEEEVALIPENEDIAFPPPDVLALLNDMDAGRWDTAPGDCLEQPGAYELYPANPRTGAPALWALPERRAA